MHNILKSILALGTFAAVHATPITFTDIVNPQYDVSVSKQGNDVYTFTHDLIDNGFKTATDIITSADLYLRFSDDEQDFLGLFTEYVNIKLDNLMADSHMEVNTGTYHFNVDTGILQSDGKVVVKLQATSGDFYFLDSRLDVAANRPEAVPEPTTMAMMAAGLLGIAFVVRRKKA